MPRKKIVAVIGAGREVEPAVSNSREMGRLIAEAGFALLTGGRATGVMHAANEGAKSVQGSLTIGILPDTAAEISEFVDLPVITDVGQARNNVIVLTADVIVACSVEGSGTASEVSLALKNGKTVILLGADDVAIDFFSGIGGERIQTVDSPRAAIEIVSRLLGS